MPVTTPYERTLAHLLLEAGVFLDKSMSPGEEGFRLKLHETDQGAPLSPYYLDLRRLQGHLAARIAAVDALHMVAGRLEFNLLAPVPTAAIALTAILAHRMNRPMVTPRLDGKRHGSGARVEGIYRKGERVLLIDDLVTRGDSKRAAIVALEEAGLHVDEILVLIDREQGGAIELGGQQIRLHKIFTITELIRYYRDKDFVRPEVCDEIMRYVAANP